MENESGAVKKSGMPWWGGVLIAVLILGAIVLIGFGWYISNYNRAVAMEQNVKQSWAQVDVVVTRRFISRQRRPFPGLARTAL